MVVRKGLGASKLPKQLCSALRPGRGYCRTRFHVCQLIIGKRIALYLKRDYRKKNPSKVDDNKTDTYKDRSNAAANKERDV
jgi:hypothetical protein